MKTADSKKIKFPAELYYLSGILFISVGTAFLAKADFGMTTIEAPVYAVYRKLTQVWPGATLGVVGYLYEAVLLVILCLIIRQFRFVYLFSFMTAVITGYTINACIALLSLISVGGLPGRLICFLVGIPVSSTGIACILRNYIPPEVYELFIKEIPRRFGIPVGRFKTAFDLICVTLAVIFSFAFFGVGRFVGPGIGTVVCALVNGTLIAKIGAFLDRHIETVDWLPLRPYFEKLERE